MSSVWTPEATQAALTVDTYDEFSRMFPDISNRAWACKRNREKRKLEPFTPDGNPVAVTTALPDPAEEDWEELFDSLERADTFRKSLSPTEEVTHVVAPDNKPFAIAFTSDHHIGAQGVDYGQMRRDLETIRDTDGLYFVVNGDIFENAKPQMKSGNALYHSLFASPREQYFYAKSRLSIARDKLIALSQGNHDARDGMVAGIDRLPDLCKHLDTVYFSEKGGTIYLTVGDQQYVIVMKHQYMGNSKITPTNSARRLWQEWPHAWESASVIALAHFHDPHVYQHEQKGRDVVWLRSGSYKVKDEWSESKGFRPSYGVPIVVFFPDEHKMVSFKDFDEGVRYISAVRAAY